MNTRHWLSNWKNTLLNSRRRSRRSKAIRPQASEVLEHKLLLTALNELAAIQGVMYNDLSENGLTGDDIRLGNETVHLYLDGGNGTFESSDGVAGGDDTFVASTTTDAVTGAYSFVDLVAGVYHVEQDSGLAGYIHRPNADFATVTITAGDALGAAGITIDDFSDPVAAQVVTANTGSPTTFSSELVAAVGGERDMFVERTGGALAIDFAANAVPGTLTIGSGSGVTGYGIVSWDGVDGAAALNTTGMSLDLTNGGQSTGIMLSRGGDFAGTLTLTVHSGANSSTLTTTVPAVLPAHDSIFLNFADFVGTADFTNVGAIELRIEGPAAFDGELDLFETYGPTVFTADFVNFVPMTLGGTVFRDINNSGTRNLPTDTGINLVDVTLFEDTNGNGTFDAVGDTQLAVTQTSGGGNYSFGNLFPGEYIVRIDAGNFAAAAALDGLNTSTGNDPAPDPDNDVDSDDNGAVSGSAVVTQAITLVNFGEPTTDGDADSNTNFTADFAFFSTVDIQVLKSDSADPIVAGSGLGNLVYTVTATNNGPSDATGVVVSDPLLTSLPTGWSLVSATGSGITSFNSGTGAWNIGSLPNGASETLTVTITVGASAAATTTTNTATVTAVNETDSNPGNDSASEDTTVTRSVDIQVLKSDSVDPVEAGSGAGNLVYTVTATNNGPSDATGVAVGDALLTSLPTGWSLVSAVGSGMTTFSSGTGTWNIGNLPNGASETLTVTITVGASAAATTTTNTAVVSAVNETDSNPLNNSDSEDTTVNRSVDIALNKSDNIDPVTAGSGAGNLLYTIMATNNGPADASGVAVGDALLTSLPTGWSLVSAVGSGTTTFSSGTGTWNIGNLPNGASETLTVTITVGAGAAATTTTNTVSVTGLNETDTNSANDTATENTTVQRSVDIQVLKSDNADPIVAGSGAGNLVYTVTATNNGPSDATGVVVGDALLTSLPTGWSLVTAVGSGTTSFSSGTGAWTIGNLASGASETLTVTITVGASAVATTTTNTATVTAINETDGNPANNTANEDTTVIRSVDIQVLKSDSADPVVAGSGAGNLVYTVTATNNGPSDATGVVVGDALLTSLPTGWSLVSAVGSGTTTFSSGTGAWTIGSLANGASETLTVTITVGAGAAATTTTNTAVVTGVNETDSNPLNNSDSEDTTVSRGVDIGLTKSDNIDPVTAGSGAGNLVYTVTATNNGPSNATGVVVSDALLTSLPTGWTLVSAVGSGTTTFSSGTGTWNIGNLANGGSETLTVTITVGASAVATTTTNTVTVTGLNETDTNAANDTATEDTTVQRTVDITVAKSDTVDPVTAGSGIGNLTYTVTATNNGPSDASGVVVADALMTSLPTGWSLVSGTGSGTTGFDSGTGLWSIGNLASGASATLDLLITIGAGAASGTTTNTVQVNAVNETESDTTNNTATEDTTVNRIVDVAVVKTDNAATITAGSGAGNLIYTVTTTNNGPSDATGLELTDAFMTALPTGFTFDSAAGDGTFDGGTGIWSVGSLNSGDSATLTVTLTVGSSAASGMVTNTATVTALNETDSDLTNNTDDEDTLIVRSVDILVVKSDSNDPVIAGSGAGNLIYTITATNNGPSDASGVEVSDAFLTSLPAGFSLVSGTGTGTTTFNGSTGVWTIGSLAQGASETLTVTVTVGASAVSGTVTNTAEVTGVNETDSNPGNNSDPEDTTISRQVDIAVVKTDNAVQIVAGSGAGNLIYTVTATNNGPSNASGVVITDNFLTALPTGFSIVSASGTGGSTFSSTSGDWTIGNLNVGESRTLTVTLTVGVTAAAGTVTNTATVTAINETDTNLTNNTDSEDTLIVRQVDVAVTKTDFGVEVVAGAGTSNLLYHITATNNGPSTATGIQLTDPLLASLPAGITFVSVVDDGGGSTFNSSTGVWDVGTLANGASRTLAVTLTVGAGFAADEIVNAVGVTRVNESDVNPANDTASETTPVRREIDLAVTKVDVVDPIQSPGQIVYTITVTNNGPSNATNVILTDTLSTLVDFASASSTQGTTVENAGVVMSMLGSLAVGSSAVVTLTVDADVPLGATVHNVASVTANETETNTTNNTDDEDTTVTPAFSSIAGIVYQDLNNNGVQDAGENPIAGTVIGLSGVDISGTPVFQTVVTNSSGAYEFQNLLQGEYSVFEIQPGIFVDGTDTAGSGATATTLNDAFINLNLSAGTAAVAFNFGEGVENESKRDFLASSQLVDQLLFREQPVTGTSSLSGQVILDTNANGLIDAGENGIPGATVILSGVDAFGNTILIYRTTAQNGSWHFNDLPAGQYSIVGAQPPAYADGVEITGTLLPAQVPNDVFASITLPDGISGTGYAFLEQPRGTTQNTTTAPVIAAQAVERGSNPVISWAPVAGADHYDVWVSQLTGGYKQVYRNQNVSGTSLEIPVSLALATHRMWVRSVDAQGKPGAWSTPVDFLVSSSPTIVSPGTSTVDTTPVIDWTDVSGAKSYDLVIENASGTRVVETTGLTSSAYTVRTALPQGNYRVWVRAVNNDFTGDWSQAAGFEIAGAPAILSPVTASVMAAPMLEWTDVGADHYEIWMNDVTGKPKVMEVTTVDGTSMLMSHSLPEGRYRVWVRGMDADGNRTAWSAAQTFTVSSTTQVLTPTGNISGNSPTITWQPVAGATHYDVWISDKSGLFVRDQNVTESSYTPTQSFPDGDYRVWVRPAGVDGFGKWSKVSNFSVGGLDTPVLTSPATTTADRTPTISWGAVDGATRYELWVNHVGVTNKVIYQPSLTTTSYTPTSNLAAGNFRIWVRAINGDGIRSAWSSALNVEIT